MSERKSKPKKFKKRGQDSSSSSSSSSDSTSSLSSDEENNAGDLKPIKEYLTDRRELARQLFLAVKGDKLRMMLPQVLKKMELSELEEWCSNELSGMSKARILSILNGQPMLQSSDSDDTDDSGPSLEIISDTEEWGDGSDLEADSREEESAKKTAGGSKREKSRVKSMKDKDKGKAKVAKVSKPVKGKIKSENDPKPHKSSDAVKVKKETEPAEQKEKDGESLLDLLELEMRARAIRALIRKEEDVIPTNPSTSEPDKNPGSKTRQKNRQLSLRVVQDKLQELDTSFNRNLAKAAQEISEEEDVVLVLEPTTTIELLSSESDGEGGQGKRRNQKFMNERILEEGETEGTEKAVEAVDDQSEKPAPKETEAEKPVQSEDKETEKVSEVEKSKEEEVSKKEEENIVDSKIGEGDEDKSTDLEIVIDLDDYPDDMEGGEASDKKKKIKKISESLNIEKRLEPEEAAGQTSDETWATRYYQTDDVQSVIKESKIQSEIRKRLRERQRLARLNNSPGLNSAQVPGAAAATTTEKGIGEKEDSPTTGSVGEYLALKNVGAEEATEKEKLEEPVVPEAVIEAEDRKAVVDVRKEAESVDEENEEGEIVDKVVV